MSIENNESETVIPSSLEDRKKLKLLLGELVTQLQKIQFEKETYKEVVSSIKEQFNLPPKVTNKMAKTMFKQNFDDVKEEDSTFETLYEIIVRGKVEE